MSHAPRLTVVVFALALALLALPGGRRSSRAAARSPQARHRAAQDGRAWSARARLLRQRHVFGHSVRGRPLVAWSLGPATAHRRVLIVGVIHGNEAAGLRITSALLRASVPAGVQLWVVPELNPDGVGAGTRQNARGVDLNRNFPYAWTRSSDAVFNSGPSPASEPETRAAMRLIQGIGPWATVWYHQHMDLVDMAGGDRGVARRYARLAHLRATCLTRLPGTAPRWSNHTFPGTTSFVVELPAGPVDPGALARHLTAVRGLERGERTGSSTRCESVTQAR